MLSGIPRVSFFFMLLIQATAVSAATFDFVRYADGTSVSPENNERGYRAFRATEDNIELKAKGYTNHNKFSY